MSDVQDTPLAIQIREAQISESDSAILQSTFLPFFQQAEQWREKAMAIQVMNVEDKASMKQAREARLALKSIRVEVEKSRKELKEESLRKGKAIDGMANVIKFLIVPLEEHLDKQENYAKALEEQRLQKLQESRAAELAQYGVDPSLFNLAPMDEATFVKLRDSTKNAFEMANEAAAKAETERIEREKTEAEERERMRIENERLKKEAAAREQIIEQERLERARVEADLKAKKDAEEKARREQEETQRQQALAPDKEKLVALADRISKIELPEVSSEEAKQVVRQAIELLSKASQFIKTKSINL